MIAASVIIPTYNRRAMLVEMLRSLCSQVGEVEFEVIVVDDGSPDDTRSIQDIQFPFTLHYIRQENQGSAAARNTGADHAQGDILIFLDDDIYVEPGYISGLVQLHKDHPHSIGMGLFRVWMPSNPTTFNIAESFSNATFTPPEGQEVPFTACVTNNVSIERTVFYKIGKMQDVGGDGPTWWGDVDFGYRAFMEGCRFRRSGAAACYHRDYAIRDLPTTSARMVKVSRMAVQLFNKFPGIAPYIPMFRDMSPVAWGKDGPGLIVRKALRTIFSARPIIKLFEALERLLDKRAPRTLLWLPLYRWIIGGYIHQGFREGLRLYGPNTQVKR